MQLSQDGPTIYIEGSQVVISKLEDLTVLKRSPDLLNNGKIGQDQLWLIMKHICFIGVAAILVK